MEINICGHTHYDIMSIERYLLNPTYSFIDHNYNLIETGYGC